MDHVAGAAPPSFFDARPHPFWSVLSILLLFALSGVSVQILPVAAPAILADWSLAGTALAAPVSAVLIGSAIGSVVGGIVSDMIGRRPLILVSAAVLGLFMGLSSLAAVPWHFVATMLVAGVAMGCFFSPGMALVTEISPPRRRALAISLTVASLPVGLTLASLGAAAILPALGWKMLFVVAGCLAIPIVLLFACFVPESPSFLAANPKRQAEFKRVLDRLSLPPVELPPPGEKLPPLPVRFGQLFAAAPIATLCLFLLFLGTNAFGNAALGWIPTAFSELGFGIAFSSGAIASWTTATMLATPVAGWLLGKYGLRIVCGGALVITTFALVLLGANAAADTPQPLLGAMLALGGLGTAGFVTSLYTLAAESFPAQLRGSGIGICDAIGRVGGVLGAYFGVHLVAFGGASGFFYLLAVVMAANLAVFVVLQIGGNKGGRP